MCNKNIWPPICLLYLCICQLHLKRMTWHCSDTWQVEEKPTQIISFFEQVYHLSSILFMTYFDIWFPKKVRRVSSALIRNLRERERKREINLVELGTRGQFHISFEMNASIVHVLCLVRCKSCLWRILYRNYYT